MAPMKLYGATMSWNVTRCVAALEEAGSEYEIVPINFSTGEHKSPEHLARNVRYFLPLSRFIALLPGPPDYKGNTVITLPVPLV
jgi:hypothetical protein